MLPTQTEDRFSVSYVSPSSDTVLVKVLNPYMLEVFVDELVLKKGLVNTFDVSLGDGDIGSYKVELTDGITTVNTIVEGGATTYA